MMFFKILCPELHNIKPHQKFLLIFLMSIPILSCASQKNQVKEVSREKKLEVVEFRPKGVVSGPTEIYVRFNLPVTLVGFSIKPKIPGNLSYNPDEFSFSLPITTEILPSTEYRVSIKVEEIFARKISEFSWSFTTSPLFSGGLTIAEEEQIYVPTCFKDELIVNMLFPNPASISISFNSKVVYEGNFHSSIPYSFVIRDNIRENDKNELKIKAEFSLFFSGKVTKEWIFYPVEDSIPPSKPAILKKGENLLEFFSKDNCSPYVNYLIFKGDDEEIGYIGDTVDQRLFMLESGICVRAEDSVGNRSECAEIPSPFKSFQYSIDEDCERIFPFGKFFLCVKNKETKILERGEKILDSEIVSVCPHQKIISDGDKILFLRDDFSISNIINFPAEVLSCEQNYLIASDKDRFLYKDKSSEMYFSKDKLYFDIFSAVNPEAVLVDVFASPISFFALFQNFTPAYLISQTQGQKYEEIKNIFPPNKNIYILISAIPQKPAYASIINAKHFYSKEQIKKMLYFYQSVIYLLENGNILIDLNPFSMGKDPSTISDKFKAKDIFLNYIDGEEELVIVEEGKIITFRKK